MAEHWTLEVERAFDVPVDALFRHWTRPEARLRWEVGAGTGMSHDAFDLREGATEIVRVAPQGTEIGHMTQTHHRVVPDTVICTTVAGHFGGTVAMVFNVTTEFAATDGGSRMRAVVQMTDLTGDNGKARHAAGWDWILGRFEDDLRANGPAD